MKMKLGNLLLAGLIVVSAGAFAQEETAEERECKRMRFLAGEAIKKTQIEGVDEASKTKFFQEAAMYYQKGEVLCGGYDKANWDRLIGSLMNSVNGETDAELKKLYTDSLLAGYDRQEVAGFYDQTNDLYRASYMLQSSNVDRVKADELFSRGIKTQAEKTHESYLTYAYYNSYMVYAESKDADAQAELKKRLIKEYFLFSKYMSASEATDASKQALAGYFDYLVRSCEDILPEIDGYIADLPEDLKTKKASLQDMINLLDRKECDDSPEYLKLVNALIDADPESETALLMKAKLVGGSEAISIYRKVKELTTDEAKKQAMQYSIALTQFKMHSYTAAYNSAIAVQGVNRGKAMKIAGQCVASNANNCGVSTFERKCNYIYAVQLLQQATGESVGGLIATYKANYPTDREKFDNGSPASVSLSCYGVSVTP